MAPESRSTLRSFLTRVYLRRSTWGAAALWVLQGYDFVVSQLLPDEWQNRAPRMVDVLDWWPVWGWAMAGLMLLLGIGLRESFYLVRRAETDVAEALRDRDTARGPLSRNPRRINVSTVGSLMERLLSIAGARYLVFFPYDDDEAYTFATDISRVLQAAGWNSVREPESILNEGAPVRGVTLYSFPRSNAAELVCQILEAHGFVVGWDEDPSSPGVHLDVEINVRRSERSLE